MTEIPAKEALRRIRSTVEREAYKVTGLPPRRLRRGISPLWFNFKKTGADQLEFFTELCDLKPGDRVLDIGCGVGRIAIPLTRYLDPQKSSYDGFDIVDVMIDWCTANITALHPNFRFHCVDVSSPSNRDAPAAADEFVFPFNDNTFDFAYAGSLFTHLMPGGAANYLRESARVLRPGGRLVATFNMFNLATQNQVPGRRLGQYWPHDHGSCRYMDEENPEWNVAFDEGWVRGAYADVGLKVMEPIRPDASYSPTRRPSNIDVANLWYSVSIIALKP